MSPLSEMLQEDEQRQLQRYIKQHGMNRSHVRDALLSLVGEQNRIFTAEDLIAISESFGVPAQVIGYVEASDKKCLTIKSEYGTFEY